MNGIILKNIHLKCDLCIADELASSDLNKLEYMKRSIMRNVGIPLDLGFTNQVINFVPSDRNRRLASSYGNSLSM